jgi:tRNA(adenine34) deaminase
MDDGKDPTSDAGFMLKALGEAKRAGLEEEIPVGALVVWNGAVIAAGRNQREALQDPTAHAEMLVLRQAARVLNSWRLDECTLYVTLEPCIMCVGAILQARIARLVFGCLDPKAGAVASLYQMCNDARLNHRVEVSSGILQGECSEILANFFAELRLRKKNARS